MSRFHVFFSVSIISSLAGCALQPEVDPNELGGPAAGVSGEFIVDNSDVAHFQVGNWARSTHSDNFYGADYSYAPAGAGESVATWNLNLIKTFNVFARWTSNSNRGTNVKYTIHHLDDQDRLIEDVVTVDQSQNGGAWFKLGTYRMSALTGRVTVSDDANGYVIADAILFEEVSEQSSDQDGDGMDDSWELANQLDPGNPADAALDPDGDGLSNLDEFMLLTNPAEIDSDGDGMDDAFEVIYGLNPGTKDASEDFDGDGFSNIEEYQALTDPGDANNVPASNIAFLSWTIPAERVDGQSLSLSEIAGYEIVYHRNTLPEQQTLDNDGSGFTRVGTGLVESTSVGGYVGENYLAMAKGGGESAAEWSFSSLVPDTTYGVEANWTSASNRASDAVYRLRYAGDGGALLTRDVRVDQRQNGGAWQALASILTSDAELVVTVTNEADGYVIADAVRVVPAVDEARTISVDDPTATTYMIKDLSPDTWVFQILVVDTDDVKSVLSGPALKVVE